MSEPPFRTIAIVGVGLIGGSVGLAARATWPGIRVIGIDARDVLVSAVALGAVTDTAGDVSAAAAADLVVLCAPVAVNVATLAAPHDVDEEAELPAKVLAERHRRRVAHRMIRERLVERRQVAGRSGVLPRQPEGPQVLVGGPEDDVRGPLRAVERVRQVAVRLRPRARVP